MISAVSLRLLYLIFRHMLGLVLLMGRPSSTKDVELLVLRHEVAVVNGAPNQTPPGVGGPGRVRRPRPVATNAEARSPPGHPGHHPGLAPPTRAQEMDLSEPAWAAIDRRRHRGAD